MSLAPAGLELTMWSKLVWSSQRSSCLSLPSVRIPGMDSNAGLGPEHHLLPDSEGYLLLRGTGSGQTLTATAASRHCAGLTHATCLVQHTHTPDCGGMQRASGLAGLSALLMIFQGSA